MAGDICKTLGDGKRDYLSIIKDLTKARAVMGYCPQFDGKALH